MNSSRLGPAQWELHKCSLNTIKLAQIIRNTVAVKELIKCVEMTFIFAIKEKHLRPSVAAIKFV